MATPLRRLRILLALAFLGSVGCNLSDYETRMVQAQALQKQRDTEHGVLDTPIDLPGYKEGRAPDILFRLPLGINPQPENREKPFEGLLFQYVRKMPPAQPGQPPQPMQPGVAPNPMPNPGGTPTNAAPALVDVFVGHRADPSGAVAGLVDEVRKQFPVPTQDPVKTKRHVQPVGRDPFDLDLIEWQDAQWNYLLVAAVGTRTQVAVVFRIEKGKQATIQKVLDISLQTLALDELAQKLRLGYGEDMVRRSRR